MSNLATEILPLTETRTPSNDDELVELIKQSYQNEEAVYLMGGGTSLNFGLKPFQEGIGVDLTQLNRVIDYPVRDMTITVEAGIRCSELTRTLTKQKQQLPLDIPQAEQATIGGVIATNVSGPRRFGHGTIRDYVIGIQGIDGRGVQFRAGGQVVKNVAGYDFCKLLTGSLGTLAAITEVTLKLKPIPPASEILLLNLADVSVAETLLANLVNSDTTPVAVELLTGSAWKSDPGMGDVEDDIKARLLVGLEGTCGEVDWMLAKLAAELTSAGYPNAMQIHTEQVKGVWERLTEFPVSSDAPLVLKASLLPSATVPFIQHMQKIDPECSIQAHAGDGIVIVKFHEFDHASDVSRVLVGDIQNWVSSQDVVGANVVVLSSSEIQGWTRRAVWGGLNEELKVMRSVKSQLDPKNILNPGRFVYD